MNELDKMPGDKGYVLSQGAVGNPILRAAPTAPPNGTAPEQKAPASQPSFEPEPEMEIVMGGVPMEPSPSAADAGDAGEPVPVVRARRKPKKSLALPILIGVLLLLVGVGVWAGVTLSNGRPQGDPNSTEEPGTEQTDTIPTEEQNHIPPAATDPTEPNVPTDPTEPNLPTDPTEPTPTETTPTEPTPTEPTPTETTPTEPTPTETTPTEPKPTEPKPTEPKPTEPKPTEPTPTEPKPTEPKPTEPTPTEPKPTEPTPTEPKPTEPPQDPPLVDGYILPESNSRYMEPQDYAHLTHWGLVLARNEIFARHGWRFETPEIRAYFEARDWYEGTVDPDDFDTDVLNEYERENVQRLREAQKEMEASYILPESDCRYLTGEDYAHLTTWELVLARNEIFARHGRRFDTPEIRAYFEAQDWYEGTIDPDDFDSDVLNEYERANVKLLLEEQHAREN